MLTVLTPASTDDLTILATLKAELGVTDAASDTYLADLITQVSGTCASFCGRPGWGRETVRQIERLAGWRDCIFLERDLVPSISSVTAADTALVADVDYELDGSLLYRLSGDRRVAWSCGRVVIEYAAGYPLLGGLPYDLERAALDLCKAWWSAKGRDPQVRSLKVLNEIETAYFDPDKVQSIGGLPIDIAARLQPYRAVAL
ncbi:hypothetical protein [Paracraurococcus lichenis]|uniref:Phage gp6-like head-tail connector protein n=1 Tax=Paracraurococcus lichenis TaxID=3064888 RepID=A0ABT9E8K7_9PROT|nr:hypothetical protein [Paracraurococcus sp. LOR1-02]MDO9712452.1 hypothetical protein [Paracraurococcus sp. LOR1-02]